MLVFGDHWSAVIEEKETVPAGRVAVDRVAYVVDQAVASFAETDLVVASGSPWQLPNGTLGNQVIVGGSPTAPLGNPLLVMSDNYFTMRYRAKSSANLVTGTTYSDWMPPVLVESWVKRVLDGSYRLERIGMEA